jgi:FtsZ-binding cell division protein ZapB
MKGAQRQRIVQTVALLAMTVMELRRIADQEPSTATQLRQIADQLEDEANDLARLSGGELR